MGKTDKEIKFAIQKGILSINAESRNEIELIEKSEYLVNFLDDNENSQYIYRLN